LILNGAPAEWLEQTQRGPPRVAHRVEDGAAQGFRSAGDARLPDAPSKKALPQLRQQILTQVFFWLPAAFVAAPDRDAAESLDAHARAALALFWPYCTPAGRRQLKALLA
jgi:hypothetical protein